jgi:hypothetical protein
MLRSTNCLVGWLLAGWLAGCVPAPRCTAAENLEQQVQAALDRAGENRGQIAAALAAVEGDERAGLQFLVAHMPDRDLQSLSSEFLVDNVRCAYRVWREAAWKDRVPPDVFLNDVLPYANINERRDNWRRDFCERFGTLVRDARSPGQAATILNQRIFGMVNVKYSTRRPKADQSPQESIEAGLASCTGLSILLIDACRAAGVPARLVGTPLWSDKSGNHTWVEIWDEGWHFTGAAEPAGDALDQAWFIGRAGQAQRDHRLHAIYAVSFRRTPLAFPLVWDRAVDYVWAVNVTDRYTQRRQESPEGSLRVAFVVRSQSTGERVAATITVLDSDGRTVFQQQANDERFDANDHRTAVLPAGQTFQVDVAFQDQSKRLTLRTEVPDQLIRVEMP